MKFDVIIGNPPYGTGANMAIKVLNKAAEYSDDIRMVLPLSFRKDSVLNKVDLDLQLTQDEQLPDDTFPRSIRAVKQRWQRTGERREKIPLPTTHPDLQFVKHDRREEATVFIGGAGAGPAGRVKTEGFLHYAKGHHLIICSEEVKQRLIGLADEFRQEALTVCCLPGLSKSAIIKIYTSHYGKEQA